MDKALLQERIDELARRPMALSPMKVIARGRDIFMQDVGGFIGYTALVMFIYNIMPFLFSWFVPMRGDDDFGLKLYLIILYCCMFVLRFIGPALHSGWCWKAKLIDCNESQGFMDYLFPVRNKLSSMFLVSLVVLLVVFPGYVIIEIVTIALNISKIFIFHINFSSALDYTLVLIGYSLVPTILIGAPLFLFAPFFVLFYDMPLGAALKASVRIGYRSWGRIWLLLLGIFLLNVVGVLALIVGVFATIAISACALYVAFADNMGLNEAMPDEIDTIGADSNA